MPNPVHIVRPPEIVPVFRLIQPGLLAGCLAGRPTPRPGTISLLAPVSIVRAKVKTTVQTDGLLASLSAQELVLLYLRQVKKDLMAGLEKRKKKRDKRRRHNKTDLFSSLSEEDTEII